MPFVRVDLQKDFYSESQRGAMSDAIQKSLHEIGVPCAEHFQVFSEKLPTELVYDETYMGIRRTRGFVVVQITLNSGRSTDDKKRFFASLVSLMSEVAGVAPGDLFVSLLEVSRDDWSFGNGKAQLAVQ